ncbi:MAG: MBL fold metallo-hydrolase [Alphaproteobacteria bacterium]|jgi:glyoxylase-like metal-dependent hydrolase (beta-lactamase superfamily II)|nr:MBL fold metallo-hydrolase [Alphaproteobacteria bacterium]MDP6565800.1 MBL fold metallo-hydrolase [Alphaproteobacteria bacterium]MDP6814519.1 MBL fold metallo-hydrolase [Alphaproteobacteria bacterium]
MTTDNWQIGDVRITRIVELSATRTPDFGYRNLSTEEILRESWLRPHFATDDGQLKSCIQAFVIETPGRRIIVDTCVGNDKERGNPVWHQLQGPFLDDLAAAGYPPDGIDTVLCTHLHIDHVGWNTMLVDGEWRPTFPNARYLFGRVEWEHWQQETVSAIAGDVDHEIAEAVIDCAAVNRDSIGPIIAAGLHELVDMDHRVCDEVGLEPTPGHTPGHVSVVIASAGQRAVITGDLMHHPIQCALPGVASKFDHDVGRAQTTRRDFLGRYADDEVLVFGTHFAAPTAGRVVSHGDTWRFQVDAS